MAILHTSIAGTPATSDLGPPRMLVGLFPQSLKRGIVDLFEPGWIDDDFNSADFLIRDDDDQREPHTTTRCYDNSRQAVQKKTKMIIPCLL